MGNDGEPLAVPLKCGTPEAWLPSLDVPGRWDEAALPDECTDFGDLAFLDSLELDAPQPELLREPAPLPALSGLLSCAEDAYQDHAPAPLGADKLLEAPGEGSGLGWRPPPPQAEPPPQAPLSSSQAGDPGPARPAPTSSEQQQRDTLLLRYWQLTHLLQQSKAAPPASAAPLTAGAAHQVHTQPPQRLAASWNPTRQQLQPAQSCPQQQGQPSWPPNPPHSKPLQHQQSVCPTAILQQHPLPQPHEVSPHSRQHKRAAQRPRKPQQEQPLLGAAWASHSGTGSAEAAQSCGASLPKRKRPSDEDEQSSQVQRALADEREQRRVELARQKSRESSRLRRERAKMHRAELERQNAQLRQDVVRLRGILAAWAAQGTVTPDQALAYLSSEHKQIGYE